MTDVKLGDLLAAFTEKLGIPECPKCADRRKALNLVAVRGRRVRDVLADAMRALGDPELWILAVKVSEAANQRKAANGG